MPVGSCVQEGIFYADDLPERRPDWFDLLQDYVASQSPDLFRTERWHKLKLYSRREWLRKVFYRLAYKGEALIVGFNLPFDLSRLAVGSSAARWAFDGGFSLTLWQYLDKNGVWRENKRRPRVAIKSISSKQYLMQFCGRADADQADYEPSLSPGGRSRPFRGHFLDLRTLAFALTNDSHSLASACDAFKVEHGKTEAEQHGIIDRPYIDYNRRDVQATGELLLKLLEEYARHPIDLQPTKAFSPASVAKAYLRKMNVVSPLDHQPDFEDEALGYAMNAFYGGRAEARIRRVSVPVVYTDFVSMYPTVNSLMGNADFLRAERVEVRDDTEAVKTHVEQTTLEDCFVPATWPKLRVLVQVEPRGEPFPVRARYAASGQSMQIGSNLLTSDEPVWYALPDVLAAKLLGGRTPKILQALRLEPQGMRPLRPAKLRGAIPIDPRREDFFRLVIQERKRVQKDAALDGIERKRIEQALKVIANAGSYGIFAELNRKPAGKRQPAIYAWNTKGERFRTKVVAAELPGDFCFPPLAALITSAARLMLAVLESAVCARGGSFAFCDTDSMAIVANKDGGLVVCPGGAQRTDDGSESVQALSWQEVHEIVTRFAALNPYDRAFVPGSILKIEDANYLPKTETPYQLYCCAISAKRYTLYNTKNDGTMVLREAKRHGLGHLVNPLDPDAEDDEGWIKAIWRYILDRDMRGFDPQPPAWFALPAVSRIGVSGPEMLRLFARRNAGKDYAGQIKPFNFMLSCQVAEFGHPLGADSEHFHLVAPYERKPDKWLSLPWFERYSGRRYAVTTSDDASREGIARIKTYGDVVEEYGSHPEYKSLGSDGEPCGRTTIGLLARRPVEARRLRYVGKESNRLDELQFGLVEDEDKMLNEYDDPADDPFVRLVVPILQEMPLQATAAAAGVSMSTLKRARFGRLPHPGNRRALAGVAIEHARMRLVESGGKVPGDSVEILHTFRELLDSELRICPVCGREIVGRRAKFCSSTCRSRDSRKRRQADPTQTLPRHD